MSGSDREPLSQHEDRPRLRAVTLLPSAATIGNLLSGLLAIFFCLLSIRALYADMPLREFGPRLSEFFPSYLAVGAYCIAAALLFDALDGRLARLARRTTEFGAQLDSLADVVSFGTAPVVLLLTLLLRKATPPEGLPVEVGLIEWRIGLLGGLVYLSCAAIRLARYNVENVRDESGQRRFSGLPVPGAAGVVAALLILHEDYVGSPGFAGWIRVCFGPLLLALGLLMVGRIDYVHVFNLYARREQPPFHLVVMVVVLVALWWWTQEVLAVVALAYLFSGLVFGLRSDPPGPTGRTHPEQHPQRADLN